VTTFRGPNRLHYVIAVAWLIATVSLASWWLAIGLSLSPNLHRMFLWEGSAFIVLLVAGGLVIVFAIRREHLRRQSLETFFMSFTHDLKTSLARLQLDADGLKEDWPGPEPNHSLDRLSHDIVRLQIQLENSLFVAQPDGRLLTERIDVRAALGRLAHDWPELRIEVDGDGTLLADARGFDAVMRNLLQNAVVHGGATHVRIRIESIDRGIVRLTVTDDGRGVPADVLAGLGQPFARAGHTGGTGIGLFVCGRLISRMQGALHFLSSAAGHGLSVQVELPGAR
jgi:signal transduction histidine kinase